MRKLFTLCLLVFTLSASAQWQQTGSKVRYVNGLGIPTRDTVAGVAADSSQIVIRPADSSLYVKYKRTWLRVGGGGGSIAGSGTTNYIPKFTSSTAIGNSSIFDNGTGVGIGTASPTPYTSGALVLNQLSSNANSEIKLTNSTTGNTAGVGLLIAQYGVNSYLLNASAGILVFGTNDTERMRITAAGEVGIGTTSPSSRLDVSGTATATNLSVTTNATVGGTLNVNGTTTLGTTNTGAISASSVNAPSGSGTFGNLYSNGIVQMLGVNVKYRNISATYTATTSDDYFINITTGTFTLNLPTAATPYGQVYVIKNSGTGTITVDPNGTQTIDGATTVTMNVQNGSITIIGDGTNWKIVSKYL